MEYADDGDVFQKIVQHQKSSTFFEEEFIWKIFITVVRGLKALHDLNIMHRDLKSANVFLNKDATGKLGDLNVSKVAKKGLSYTQTGTPYYASPEVWRDEAYDTKSDIWSLGCVLYEMITLKPPFRAENMQGLYKKVLKGQYPKISDKYSVDIQTIVRILLQVNPKKRPSCGEILNHGIVKKMIKKYFPDEDEESDSETIKNELLQTIYFPKGTMNIGYLTDKLPKPSYKNDFGSLTERKSNNNSNSSSSLLPALKNTSPLLKKSLQPKQKSKGDRKSLESLPSLGNPHSPKSMASKLNSEEKPSAKAVEKMNILERIANKIEEAKIEAQPMNLDKEYNDIKQIIQKSQIGSRGRDKVVSKSIIEGTAQNGNQIMSNPSDYNSPTSKQMSSLLQNSKNRESKYS